jgi:peptidyl-tRNA hydrolase, PTH1 family
VTTVLCGLGNPGKEYAKTRHNVGFMLLERVAEMHGIQMKSSFSSLFGRTEIEGRKLKLLMPQTFMNNSGVAVGKLLQYYRLPLSCLVVAHDDMDLPLGSVKAKFGGGSAGHNGIKSIDQHLGNQYWRVRLGIGRPPADVSAADYVLSNFLQVELEAVNKSLSFVTNCIEQIVALGMSKFKNL